MAKIRHYTIASRCTNLQVLIPSHPIPMQWVSQNITYAIPQINPEHPSCPHSLHHHSPNAVKFIISCGSAPPALRRSMSYMSPPRTSRPRPATSVLTPCRVPSSSSRSTFETRILRTALSAFANASPTLVVQASGPGMRRSKLS